MLKFNGFSGKACSVRVHRVDEELVRPEYRAMLKSSGRADSLLALRHRWQPTAAAKWAAHRQP